MLTSQAAGYRKLSGRAKRNFGLVVNDKQRLWLGEDHILLITLRSLTERYKRFYFNDIQALTLQKTPSGAILNTILLILAAIMAIIIAAGIFNGWPSPAYIVPALIGFIMLLGAVINTVLGPTCSCHLLTAIHEEPLFCLGRINTAQKVIEELRVIVENVQGITETDATSQAQPMSEYAAQETGGT